MRIVLDTNVLISAALKRTPTPATAVDIIERHHIILKSAATERQLFDVLARPYFVPLIGDDTRHWLRRLSSVAERVVVADERIVARRDPTDDKFLELAVGGRADFIVSGDADLLALRPFRAIPIVTPAGFLQGWAVNRKEFVILAHHIVTGIGRAAVDPPIGTTRVC